MAMGLVQRKIATLPECAAGLRKLSDAELRRLDEAARLRAVGLSGIDGSDLFHEAVARMLEGRRQWPLEVRLEVFLVKTVQSIASDHRRRQQSAGVVAESDVRTDPETGDGVITMAGDESMAPQDRVSAAETLTRIDAMFSGDTDAQAVMVGKAYGMSPSDIQKEHAMSETQYATTLRRIRRGVARLSEKGEDQA